MSFPKRVYIGGDTENASRVVINAKELKAAEADGYRESVAGGGGGESNAQAAAVERQPYPVKLYTDSDDDQKPRTVHNALEELQAMEAGYARRVIRRALIAAPPTLLAEALSEMEPKAALAQIKRSGDVAQLEEAKKAESRLSVEKAIDARLIELGEAHDAPTGRPNS